MPEPVFVIFKNEVWLSPKVLGSVTDYYTDNHFDFLLRIFQHLIMTPFCPAINCHESKQNYNIFFVSVIEKKFFNLCSFCFLAGASL